jgi:hypothetical protein
MKNSLLRKYDKQLGIVFTLLTLAFIILAFSNESFFKWAFERHQNQLSWYVRPLFLIPFCYFAYKRSFAGIMATIFLLFTSMFWFPKPAMVSEQVKQFLEMEKQWLTGNWDTAKVLMTLLVPASLFALGMALWKRSFIIGIAVIVFMAAGKMVWSVWFGGEAGKTIFIPALLGLGLCVGLVYLGFRRLEKNKRK